MVYTAMLFTNPVKSCESCPKNASGVSQTALSSIKSDEESGRLCFGLGLAQAEDTVTGLPLTAFLQQGYALKAFEDIAFRGRGRGRS
jgi:hypothetical protein